MESLPPADSASDPVHAFRIPHLHGPLAPLAFAILLAARALPAHATTSDTYIGPTNGFWSAPANWSAGTPNSSSFNVLLTNSGGLNTFLDSSETINNLTLSSPNTLTLQASTTLALAGPSLTNTGTLLISTGASLNAGTANITGGGSIQLLGSLSMFQSTASIYSDNIISGQGTISVSTLTSDGTITASLNHTLALTGTTYNGGTLRADGGTLILEKGASGGTIDATNHGVVQLGGALQDVTLTSSAGGSITLANYYGVPIISGNTVDNAILTSPLRFSGNASLSGSGSLVLASISPLDASSTLTCSVPVYGSGTIVGPVHNTGIIIASSTANTLIVTSTFTNTAALRADGGTLSLLSGQITNTGGTIESRNGSEIYISNATISGGALTTDGVRFRSSDIHSDQLTTCPPVLFIIDSSVSLDTLTSTAFDAANTFNFLAVTIQITNSSVSIASGMSLLNGASLAISSGTFTTTAPITLSTLVSQVIPIGHAVSTVTFDSTIPNSQSVSTISGNGQVVIGPSAALVSDGILSSSLIFSPGSRLTIRPSVLSLGASKTTVIDVAGTTNNWTSTLDITSNALIVETGDPIYPTDTQAYEKANQIPRLLNQIQSARSALTGPWTGTGITSSTVAQDAATQTAHSYHTTLALYDNAAFQVPFTAFAGQTVDANSLIITRALVGDGDLNGTVDNADLVILLTHYGLNGQTQAGGDFDGNGTVDNADLVALLTDYGQSLPGGDSLLPANTTTGAPASASATPAPEPASLAAILPAAFLLRRRKRTFAQRSRAAR